VKRELTTHNSLRDCHTYERHAHRCESCGHVWAHDYSLAFEHADDPKRYASELDRYAAAHRCPNCGESEYRCHDGNEPVITFFDGVTKRKLKEGEILEPENPSRAVIRYRKILRDLSEVSS
jgi:hypothetical protein